MKKLFIINLILALIAFGLPSQARWIMTDSVDSPIVDIKAANGRLFICTAASGFYVSYDSGYNFISSNNGLENLNTRQLLIKDSMLVLGTNNSIYKSLDFGDSWILSSDGFPTGGTHSNVEGIVCKGDSIFVATYGNGVYCSLNDCQDWFPINNGFIDLYRSCLFLHGDRLFTGTAYGGSGIYISDDAGQTWVQKNEGVPKSIFNPDKYVDITSFTNIGSSIFASTHEANILKSDDNGETWERLSAPNNFIWIVINFNDMLLCGHDGTGVSKSFDSSNSWFIINEGFETTSDMTINSLYVYGSYLYAGTSSHKIFRRPVNELLTGIRDQKDPVTASVYS